MTNTDLTELRSFESDVRQLIKSYKVLRDTLSETRRQLSERDAEIERLESDLRQARRSYSTLKLARMIEVSDSDLKESKSRITRLVREVNKCISLLSSEIDETEREAATTVATDEKSDIPASVKEDFPSIEMSLDDMFSTNETSIDTQTSPVNE